MALTKRRWFLKHLAIGIAAGSGLSKSREVFAFPRPSKLTEDTPQASFVPPENPRSRLTILKNANKKWLRTISSKPFALSEITPGKGEWDSQLLSYSKGLPHSKDGIVEKKAFQALHKAIQSKRNKDFEDIPLLGPKKLKNPLAALSLDFCGFDCQQYSIAAPPSPDSAEFASELKELYWLALLRDVPFSDYPTSQLVQNAVVDLRTSQLPYRVTQATLAKGTAFTTIPGPFVSQFLLRPWKFGSLTVDPRVEISQPVDYLTDRETWLFAQNGFLPGITSVDPTRRYIITGRDLLHYVWLDEPSQAGVASAMILKELGVPLSVGNPYVASPSMNGFVSFDFPHLLSLIHQAVSHALRAAWYQKWFVSRRGRPEEIGGRIDDEYKGIRESLFHSQLFQGDVLEKTASKYGSVLLPQAFAEGCPLHPAYPGGHASFLGATVTLLKAWFDGASPYPNPQQASPDGLSLIPYEGEDAKAMTIAGELDKLAWNIAIGRCFAGIHYRSDCEAGLRLGEAAALSVLNHLRLTCPEKFSYSFTSFDKKRITSRS